MAVRGTKRHFHVVKRGAQTRSRRIRWGGARGYHRSQRNDRGLGRYKAWCRRREDLETTVVHAASDTTSGIALDADLSGSALMLYTLNKKSGYLYESVHKNNNADGLSIAASYVAKC